MKQELVEEIVRRAMAALQYTAFDNPDQNNEFELKVTSNAIYFIPIMPTTYVIDESFYYKIYNILNISLISTLTMIRPLSMQIRILPDNEPSKQSALYYPMHPGRSKRLVGSIDDFVKIYHQTNTIPLMDRIGWNPLKSVNCIIEGPSGSGKSYAMQYLLSIISRVYAKDNGAEEPNIVVIDPKVSNLARFGKNNPGIKVIIPDFDSGSHQGIIGRYLTSVVNELKRLETEMYRRQSLLYKQSKIAANFSDIGLPPNFLFIDEAAALLCGANRQIKQDYLDTLTRISILGRESGLTLILGMQQARSDYLSTMVRDSISVRIHIGRLNSENARFLFPELSNVPMIPFSGVGSGIISMTANGNSENAINAGIEPISMPTIIDNNSEVHP